MKRQTNNLHGIILLDKPTGISSNKALQKVKHLFNAKKAGHTGSLDPLATGLLPICLGQATKVSEYLLHGHKKYTTVIKLGETTDTLDSEGEVLETNTVAVSDQQIQDALEQFRGDIQQVPPMYSALKRNGQPLYKLARKGQEVERKPRNMTVFSLNAERLDDLHLHLNVHCSSGFYIRSLAHDLGQALGCGAHVVELRRTAIKDVIVEQAITLQELEKLENRLSCLLPIDSLLQDMPRLIISEQEALSLSQGRVTEANGNKSEVSRLYIDGEKLFGIGLINAQGILKTEKIFVLGD